MDSSEHAQHQRSNKWLLGGIAASSAVVLSPYVLPSFGLGPSNSLEQIVGLCNNSGVFGSGLAGTINQAFSEIPLIGSSLAAGGWTSVLSSGIIGLGGSFLGEYIHKKYDHAGHIPWGRVIKYAAIATSMLIALPSLLGGLTMGLGYLASLVGGIAFASDVLGLAGGTLGLMGSNSIASIGAGITGFLPHLITCGAAFLPVGLATILGSRSKESDSQDHHTAQNPSFELVACAMPEKGQPCQMSFRLRDPQSGLILTPDTLDTTFTKKFHLMLVDQTLSEYHHLHPDYDSKTGLFNCVFTPSTSQPFTAWCDFTPKATGKPIRALENLPATRSICLPARISTASDVSTAGITAHVTSDTPLTMGKDSILRVELRDAAGQPISNLGPVMGAYAHLAGFSADKQHFIHTHPITPLGAPIRNGTLEFHISPEHAGLSKFFLQINHEGHEVFIPFGRVIAPNVSYREKVTSAAPSQHQHAMA